MSDQSYLRADLAEDAHGPSPHWGWPVAIGILSLVLGFIAALNLLISTVASVLVVGIMMIVAGIAQFIAAVQAKGWGRTLLWIAAGLLYALAGVLIFVNPVQASFVLTLVLGFVLIFAGVARVVFGIGLRPTEGWGWLVAAGVLSAIVGVLVLIGWPGTVWMLGFILAVDLVAQGAAWLALGLALRRGPKPGDGPPAAEARP